VIAEQLTLKEYYDPFTGEPVKNKKREKENLKRLILELL